MPTSTIAQPANLAQLKRACTQGTRLLITNHWHQRMTRVTVVTEASTVDLITRVRSTEGSIEDSHLGWGKASDWTFDEVGAHQFVSGKPWIDLVILAEHDTVDPKIPDLYQGGLYWLPGQKAWANVEGEGARFSVGPFEDLADADHFRALMFSDPNWGDSSHVPAYQQVSVAEFQARHRADFVGRIPPSPHWNAR